MSVVIAAGRRTGRTEALVAAVLAEAGERGLTVTIVGATDREIAAKAWDEGRESFAVDMLKPLDDSLQRPQTANPYRVVSS